MVEGGQGHCPGRTCLPVTACHSEEPATGGNGRREVVSVGQDGGFPESWCQSSGLVGGEGTGHGVSERGRVPDVTCPHPQPLARDPEAQTALRWDGPEDVAESGHALAGAGLPLTPWGDTQRERVLSYTRGPPKFHGSGCAPPVTCTLQRRGWGWWGEPWWLGHLLVPHPKPHPCWWGAV